MGDSGAFNSLPNLKGNPKSTVGESFCLLPEPPSFPSPGRLEKGFVFVFQAAVVDA